MSLRKKKIEKQRFSDYTNQKKESFCTNFQENAYKVSKNTHKPIKYTQRLLWDRCSKESFNFICKVLIV